MPPRLVLTALVSLLAVVAAGCGGDEPSSTSAAGTGDARTIDIDMVDIAFRPAAVEVQGGETVRFRFHNTGAVAHDAFIGDEAAQAAHDQEMTGGHSAHGGSDDALTVEPGKTGELQHTFDAAGETLIGCHEPGHYEAGMRVAVTVS